MSTQADKMRELSIAFAKNNVELERAMARLAEQIKASLDEAFDLYRYLPSVETRFAERAAAVRYEAATVRYEEAIAREREEGLRFVKALGVQARFDLGLPLCEPPKYKGGAR